MAIVDSIATSSPPVYIKKASEPKPFNPSPFFTQPPARWHLELSVRLYAGNIGGGGGVDWGPVSEYELLPEAQA